jgi:excisionase family DNA binding protein
VNIAKQAPEYGRIATACDRYGLSRSRLYLLAGEGRIRFVKVGNATLVDYGSLRRYLAACPPANISGAKSAQALSRPSAI